MEFTCLWTASTHVSFVTFPTIWPWLWGIWFRLMEHNQTTQPLKLVLRALLKIPHAVGWVGFKTLHYS